MGARPDLWAFLQTTSQGIRGGKIEEMSPCKRDRYLIITAVLPDEIATVDEAIQEFYEDVISFLDGATFEIKEADE